MVIYRVRLSTLPVQSHNPGIVVHLVQKLVRVLLTILNELTGPNHPVSPVDILTSLHIGVRNGANFCHSQNSLVLGQGLELLVLVGRDSVVTNGGIVIDGGDVAFVVSGIPGRISSVANPDQVVEVVVASDAVVEDIPQLLEGSRTLGTPPEPATLGLVERAEENGHVGLIQALDLSSNGVDITQQELVVGAVAMVVDGFRHVEAGGLGVESLVPRLFLGIEQTGGSVPMPNQGIDSIATGVLDYILDRVRLAAVGNSRRRVVGEVAAEDGRGHTNVLLDPVVAVDVLLSGYIVRSILKLDVLQERSGAGGGRLVNVAIGQSLVGGAQRSRAEKKRKEGQFGEHFQNVSNTKRMKNK